jgi:hypothetical protein
MTEFILPKGVGCKVRLWVDELPATATIPLDASRLNYTLPAQVGITPHSRAAIELFQPGGGSFRYGMLGAEFTPDSSGELLVVVPSEMGEVNAAQMESLAGDLDRVVVGCTPEYARAVYAGVEKIQTCVDRLPGGCLNFSVVAHGEVGSSPAVFEMLARAVVRLIHDSQPRTPHEAAALLSPA